MLKLFKDYWEGKVPLVKSYWIGCILIPIALVIPILPALGGGRVSDGYAMFTVLGLMAFFAIFFKSLVRQTYIIYAVIFTSLILGRVLNYFLTEDLNNTIMIVTAAEIVVVLLCLIRLFFLRRRKEEETE